MSLLLKKRKKENMVDFFKDNNIIVSKSGGKKRHFQRINDRIHFIKNGKNIILHTDSLDVNRYVDIYLYLNIFISELTILRTNTTNFYHHQMLIKKTKNIIKNLINEIFINKDDNFVITPVCNVIINSENPQITYNVFNQLLQYNYMGKIDAEDNISDKEYISAINNYFINDPNTYDVMENINKEIINMVKETLLTDNYAQIKYLENYILDTKGDGEIELNMNINKFKQRVWEDPVSQQKELEEDAFIINVNSRFTHKQFNFGIKKKRYKKALRYLSI